MSYNPMKRLLIIGNRFDHHLSRFVTRLRGNHPSFAIDIFDASMRTSESEADGLFDNVYCIRHGFSNFLYRIPVVAQILKGLDTIRAFKAIAPNYKVFNIQFVTLQACIIAKYLKHFTAKVITTPWGSDVYRIPKMWKPFAQKVYDNSDYVCVMPNTKFGNDVKRIYNVPEEKCQPLCFGSDVLDAIANSTLTHNEAKKLFFGDENLFVIVCGYNAAKAQNHVQILESLASVKHQLPNNTLIVLPMTYGDRNGYVSFVEESLKKSGLKFLILKSYLSDEQMVQLRLATDLFIHMQTTDAYSSSLHEYLLCNAKIINGNWLRYDELEQDGVPYTLSDFNTLSEDIIATINAGTPIRSEALDNVLDSYKWSTQIRRWKTILEELALNE